MFFKKPHLNRNKRKFATVSGLPSHYPAPEKTRDLLFYIQRNHNLNTVIYNVNLNLDGTINENEPIAIQWIRYDDEGETKALTVMQSKLAYGCNFKKINHHSFQFHFVSYDAITFYLSKHENDFAVFYRRDGEYIRLSNIYVHAEEFGLFPDVKFIELYGTTVDNNRSILQKIRL